MRILMCLFFKLFTFQMFNCLDFEFDSQSSDLNTGMPEIFLISNDQDPELKRLNDNMRQTISKEFMNDKFIIRSHTPENMNLPLKDLWNTLNDKKYIIYLNAPDFYQNNYNEIWNIGIGFAGNIGRNESKAVLVCNMETTAILSNCTKGKQKTTTKAKIVSKDLIIDHPNLYDIVNKFTGETIKNPAIVDLVVCYDNFMTLDITGIAQRLAQLSYLRVKQFDARCSHLTEYSNVLAIVAPKPIDGMEVSDAPKIFYDEIYPDSLDGFENAFTAARAWKQLKYVYVKFMEKMEWNRVAIVSDDTLYAEQFERELRTYFDTVGVVYTVKQCRQHGGNTCDFSEALDSLNASNPTIMIANAAEKYAEILATQSLDRKMTAARRLAWITRDWAPIVAQRAAKDLGLLYTISLGPKITEPYSDERHRRKWDYLTYSRIIEPLHAFVKLNFSREINELTSTETGVRRKQELRREMTRDLRNEIQTNYVAEKAYVVTYHSSGLTTLTATMDVYLNHATVSYFNQPKVVYSDVSECILKSNHYYNPCNDNDLFLIMGVIIVFFVTLLGIVYFFQTDHVPYSRMNG